MTETPERIWIDNSGSPVFYVFKPPLGLGTEYTRSDIVAEKDAKIAELEHQLATAKERALEAERVIQAGWIQNVEAARNSGFEEMRQAAIEIVEFELPHEVDSVVKYRIVLLLKHRAIRTLDDLRNAAIAEAINVKRWRHIKRGTTYTEIGRGKFQVHRGLSDLNVVIYQGDDGQFWVRPESEFDDGRFEPIKLETKK